MVNNIRVIAFNKYGYNNLELNTNLQITNFEIYAKKKTSFFDIIENNFLDALKSIQEIIQKWLRIYIV